MYMVGVIRRISLGGLILLSRERGEGGKTKKFRVKLRDTHEGEENGCKRGMNSFGRNNRERERDVSLSSCSVFVERCLS